MNWKESLDRLVKLIPPPAQPKYAGKIAGPCPAMPQLPDDFCELIAIYGSGEFTGMDRGCIVELNNPLDSWNQECAKEEHEILAEWHEQRGVPPHPVYPAMPGLLLWGASDQREQYLWKADGGDPNLWSTAYVADLEDTYEFDMPAVVFLQRLLCGEIHRKDLGYNEPDYDPSQIEFQRTFR